MNFEAAHRVAAAGTNAAQTMAISALKKPDMASGAEALLAGAGWLPSLLRKRIPATSEPGVHPEAPSLTEQAA